MNDTKKYALLQAAAVLFAAAPEDSPDDWDGDDYRNDCIADSIETAEDLLNAITSRHQ